MLIVEVHSNNVLTVRDDTFACAISDSKKHETVKFLFPENWEKYSKTAVFSANGVEPINVLLDSNNALCLSNDECFIPFEVLKGNSFILSVFGERDSSLATTPRIKIDVLESGYALGDEPQNPTPDQYSQIIDIMKNAESVAQSVRDDANAGLFIGAKGDKGDKGEQGVQGIQGPKGEKGSKGEKGDKGDDYNLTDADKREIARMIDVENVDVSNAASAIKNTVSGKSITLTDVSPIPHKCSCRLTRDNYESKNILNLETADINVGFKNNSSIQDDFLTITYNNDGSITVRGSIPEGEVLMVQAYIRGMIKGKEYTASLRASNNTSIGFEVLGFGANNELIKEYSNNITEHTFTYGDDNVEYYFINSYAISNSNVADLNIGEITFYLQLEEGGQMTEWQPCVLEDSSNDFSTVKVNVNGKTYTPTEDGLVIGIDSISPTMEITTDNPNLNIVDFSYSVDTKDYVDKKTKEWETIVDITLDETNGDVNKIEIEIPQETIDVIKQCTELMCFVEFTAKHTYTASKIFLRAYLVGLNLPVIYTSNGAIAENNKVRALARTVLSDLGSLTTSAQLTPYDLFNSASATNNYICQIFDNIKEKNVSTFLEVVLDFSSSQTERQTFGAGTHFKIIGRK